MPENVKGNYRRMLSFGGVAALAILAGWISPGVVSALAANTQNAKVQKAGAPGEVTVKGEVVDLWCFIDHKGHGEKHKACAITCAKAGNPMGIVDAAGHIYLLMGAQKHQPGRDVMIDHMADTVNATGKLIKSGGIDALYVTKVQK